MRISFTFEISFGIFDKLQKKGAEFKRRVGDKFLYHDGNGYSVVDEADLPDDLKNSRREKKEKTSGKRPGRGSSDWSWKKEKKRKKRQASDFAGDEKEGRQYRQPVYDRSSETKIAKRAADNHYIMQDVLSDPSLVGSDSETEAVAKVASENPGWAKMSDLVDAYDIDVDADGNVSSPGTDTGSTSAGGESSANSLAEAASDAASYNGSVSTADAGDLGPTGASGYSTGDGGSSGSTGDIGGDAGGGDIGGGDL